jgi:hypothetical protein
MVSNRMPPNTDTEAQARAVLDTMISGLQQGALDGVSLAPAARPGKPLAPRGKARRAPAGN